jgi:predicted nucleotidyltransferase
MRRRPGEEANEISLVGSRVDVPDIRYTLRGFRRSPGSFVAVISLALEGAPRGDELNYAYKKMRINSKGTVGGFPALLVRKLVGALTNRLYWDLETVERILHLKPNEASGLVKALEAAGLAKASRGRSPKKWTTTQLAQSFASATAAKPITRQTAEKSLAQFLERVNRVNHDDRFLAKVTRVILFGSYLNPELKELVDVDVGVELQPKESDRKRLRELNYERVEQFENNGHRLGRALDREVWWHAETFRFLKGRSRSISLLDYQVEKEFVDQVPHKVLFSAREERSKPAKEPSKEIRRTRRPKGCPF